MQRFCVILGLIVFGLGCDTRRDGAGNGKIEVVATTTMVGDLVRQIAGDRLQVTILMGAGVDPHTYKPSLEDLAACKRAAGVFYNGLHLEGKMVELFERELRAKAFAVSENLTGDLLAWKDGEAGAHDPHIWFDVRIWSKAAANVGSRLKQIDPAGAAEYQQRTDEIVKRLEALDAEVRQKLASIPVERRVLVTSHDAYSYFGRAYAVDVRGLQGISTESEAGVRAISSAVEFIIEKKLPAIFVESSVSHKAIERVRDDCRSRGWNVVIGGELYSDAMGVLGEHPPYAVETYEGMVRYNVDTLVKALGGSLAGSAEKKP